MNSIQTKSGQWLFKNPRPISNGPLSLPICSSESFGAYVESAGGQERFRKVVGYSRKAINQFVNGKAPTPKALKVIQKQAIALEELRTENAKLKRLLKK